MTSAPGDNVERSKSFVNGRKRKREERLKLFFSFDHHHYRQKESTNQLIDFDGQQINVKAGSNGVTLPECILVVRSHFPPPPGIFRGLQHKAFVQMKNLSKFTLHFFNLHYYKFDLNRYDVPIGLLGAPSNPV